MEHVCFWYMLSFMYFVKPQIPQLVDASRRTGLGINAEKAYYVPYPCIKEYLQYVTNRKMQTKKIYFIYGHFLVCLII